MGRWAVRFGELAELFPAQAFSRVLARLNDHLDKLLCLQFFLRWFLERSVHLIFVLLLVDAVCKGLPVACRASKAPQHFFLEGLPLILVQILAIDDNLLSHFV